MTSTQQAASRIGTHARMTIEGGKLTIIVKVEDHKSAYGDDRWLVTPAQGAGSMWVSASRIAFDAPAPRDACAIYRQSPADCAVDSQYKGDPK